MMRRELLGAGLISGVIALLSAGCMSEVEGLAPSQPAATTVSYDFFHLPLPTIPLPSDIATRHDATSPTGRRINASLIAPSAFERRARKKIDELDGWGVLQSIWIPFTGPLDVQSVLDAHRDADYDLTDDVVYLVDVDPDSPQQGRFHHIDLGQGNFPAVAEDLDGYWKNDPRGWTLSVFFEEADEDLDGDGVLDPGEDTDLDGVLDKPNYLPGAHPARDDLAGRADALMTFYERETHTLILRPMMPLRERTTYAVVVMRRLKDINGEAVGSPFPWIHHLNDTKALRPLPGLLEPQGIALDEVAFAFTFSTGTVEQDWIAVRDGLYGHGVQGHMGRDFPARLNALEAMRDTSHDLFKDIVNPFVLPLEDWIEPFGIIVDQLLGEDDGSQAYVKLVDEGARYIDFIAVGGYMSPQLFERYDEASGELLALDHQSWPVDLSTTAAPVRGEQVWFTLTVPRKEVSVRGEGKPAPVAIMGHGYTANRFAALQEGSYLPRHGVGVISIDCVSHHLVLDADEQALASDVLGELYGLGPAIDALTLRGRGMDLNGDGRIDSGGDFWTAYMFHTRDVVRQCALDTMQLTRILRSFDGVRTWDFDVNGDGQPDLAGDFDGDGVVDVGGDAPIYISGGSLGGIMSVVTAAMDPNITGAAPIAGGGGLTDVAARSKQGGVREAVTLRVMGPLYVGTQLAGSDELVLETIIPDVNRTGTVRLAAVEGRAKGDTLVTVNVANGARGCGYVWEDAQGHLRVRSAVESSFEDAVRVELYAGDALVTGTADCELKPGATPDRVVDTFEEAVTFQAREYPQGAPLVALAEGMGRKRATPGFRRFSQLGQLVLDPADPAVLVPHALQEPLTYPGTGETTGSHLLIITTLGDMNVPASGGLTQARAAGLVDFLTPDPRYGVPPNQVLIDNHVAEAVHTLGRYRTPSGEPVHKDVENFALGADPWGDTIPRIDVPLHLGFDRTDKLGGKSAAIFPYTVPTGQHGFMFPGQMWDYARKQCQAACVEGEACDCPSTAGFDIGNFMFNMIGRWFRTDGQVLDADQCMSRDDCDEMPPPPELRGAARL